MENYFRSVWRYVRHGAQPYWLHRPEVTVEVALSKIMERVRKVDVKLKRQLEKVNYDCYAWENAMRMHVVGDVCGPDRGGMERVNEQGSVLLTILSKKILKRQRNVLRLRDKRRRLIVFGVARNMLSYLYPRGCTDLNTYPSAALGRLFEQGMDVEWSKEGMEGEEKLRVIGRSAACLLVSCGYYKRSDANNILAEERPVLSTKIKFQHLV